MGRRAVLQPRRCIPTIMRALTMKIKNHVAYYVPLSILVLIIVASMAAPAEPRGAKLCKQYSNCYTSIPSFSGWPGLR